MNITFKGTNLEIGSDMRAYADEKAQSIIHFLNEAEDRQALVDVELEKVTDRHQNGKIYRAEFNVSYEGKLYRAESTEESIFTALDKVKDEIVRTITTSREKKVDFVRKGAQFAKNMLRGFNKDGR